jgi:hypothetical protein
MSRGDVTLNVPSLGHERNRRMSRHDALASTLSNQSIPDTNKSK